MKLDHTFVSFMENVMATARQVGIDDVIIEQGLIRAMDDKKTVIINHALDDELPFNSIGISRIGVLQSRLELAKGQDNFEVTATLDDENGWAKTLLITAKGVKVDFRCPNPEQIKAPKSTKDEMACLVPLDADAVVLLQKGQAAMGADSVRIISNANGVSFEMYDVNNDKFTHTYEATVESLNGGTTDFVHNYPLKIVLPLFRENAGGTFAVGQKGILNLEMNGINLFVIPQVG
jgi:hypothetical protein